MASKETLQRYRHCYRMLLRLYPKPYYNRFGESMEQTFSDLCREQSASLLWIFVETSTGIMKEHVNVIRMPLKNLLRIVLVVAALLLIPFLVMQFQISVYDPGSGFEPGVNWTLSDFVIMGTLLFITGLGLDLALRKAGKYKVAAGVAIVGIFLWIWAELAVGVFTNIGS